MSRLLTASVLALWLGVTLLLSERRWFRRPALVDRLRPYLSGASARRERSGVLSVGSFREVIAPAAALVGSRVARVLGVTEDLALRLQRLHAPLDVGQFRVRQLGWSATVFAGVVVASQALGAPGSIALLVLVGAPMLTFLIVEQQLAAASARRQRRIFLELPVIAEQLAMLLSAGYSLGAALNRLARRGHGACSEDLRLVCARIRQGLDEVDALREWSRLAGVDAVDRLVTVLALNREAGDLGRLISEEARGIRRDAQRETVETMERRAQQVWIPVTVATLVPGVLFLAVPFIEAMRLFSNGG